jgi:sugar lactone lactonase YvrE
VRGKLRRQILAAAVSLTALAVVTIHPANVGAADGTYQLVENWAQLPPEAQWGSMSGVDIDRNGNIYVLQRAEPSKVMVFDAQGKYLRAWGEGEFPSAHGLRVLRDGSVWITDRKLEQVLKFNPDGKLLMTIGQKGIAGDNDSKDAFNGVSDLAMAKNGDLFVADGEGANTRVVKFSKDGKFIKSWGTKGSGPGELNVPHGIAVDAKGRIWVCDRSNKRLQVFDQDGKFLEQTTQFGAASSIFITKNDMMYVVDFTPENRITIGTTDGTVLEKIEGLNGPHGITVDSSGAIYVAEVNGKNVLKYVKR